MNSIKEILIISGKGGTGKTTITASLCKIMSNMIIADTDVDAADMYIMLNPKMQEEHVFMGRSKEASIDMDKCTSCGLCKEKCRFNAISETEGIYKVNPFSCEGCTLCYEICPSGAITMNDAESGKWYVSKTDYGTLIHARLNPGAENSGNLVSMVKHEAKVRAEKEEKKQILIDGPPGIGCPVTSSLSGADIVIIVTEPTVSGLSDLKRVISVARNFDPAIAVVINKADINVNISKQIEQFAKDKQIPVIARIPFDRCIIDLLSEKMTPMDTDICPNIKKEIEGIAQYIGGGK